MSPSANSAVQPKIFSERLGCASYLCNLSSASRAVVGVSRTPGLSAFFKGLNSSSLRHSQTTKLSENWKTSNTNFSNLMPFAFSGQGCWTEGIFFLAEKK